ncbi:MAG: C-terminal processing protease CtpA/Prc, contains a domain [Phycisphaerales bacterium]|nr:C-terminal processing protease CtpA/Prc, contains a domain [Phycisphaerales bacterium]
MMKKCLSRALLIALILLPVGIAPHPDTARAAPIDATAQKLTAAEAQSDFDLMRHALEEAHAGLYRYTTKAEMDRVFDARRTKLNRPMDKGEFMPVIQETLARIRCGHTSMNADEGMETAMKNARTFPLRVLMEGTRVMVMLNDTPGDATIRPGMEVVEINGRKVSDILARFWPLLSGDGDIETGKRHDITGRFAKYYWWLVEQPGEFTVKARDDAGTTVVAKLAGVTDAERKKNQNPVNAAMMAGVGKVMGWSREDLSVRFLKEPEVAEIHLRYFMGDNYPKWVEDTFRMLREKGTKTLIIDMRGNGGGKDEYGAMLVSYLTDKPFRYFDHIDIKTIAPSFKEHLDWDANVEGHLRDGTTPNPAGGYFVTAKLHPGLAEQQPGKFPFLGKVFVLIEGGTFSTAADFCAVTRHLKRATFIGEETGGGYYGNNSGMMPTLTLPNSKLEIRLPMYEYWNAVSGDEGKRHGTMPDHLVEMRTADVLRGVDAPLDLAMKLAAESAPSK